jgi:NCAIR mutase (PurE)-related protein
MSLAKVPSGLIKKTGKSPIQDVMKCVLCHKHGRFMSRKEELVQKKNMLKRIRHSYNANFRIMVLKHAKQTTVRHKKIVFLRQISKGGDKEKLKNVSSV